MLGPDGPISIGLPRYERRDAQITMADAVERAIAAGGVLLAEAGTGTGKTLAYLIPSILSGRTTVIATGTKNLQEQVFFKDIAFLERTLGHSARAVYLKGQDNYLCLRRLERFTRSPRVLAYPQNGVAALTAWARTTATGDRMDLAELADDDPLWLEVCSTRETRIGARCPFHGECFVTRARQQAARAGLIIVNHHLYFADLATRRKGGSILPSHDIVVFDEAHGIENAATEFFSVVVSSKRIAHALEDALHSVQAARLGSDPHEQRRHRLVATAAKASSDFFDRFRRTEGRIPFNREDFGDSHDESYHRLDAALEAAEVSMRGLAGQDEGIDHNADRIRDLRDDLATVVSDRSRDFVHWLENRKRSVILGASPIDVSNVLREGVFFSIRSVILTSATLSTGGDFTFLKNRLGIDFDVDEMSLPSPFDFQRQACLYVPETMPDPRDESFIDFAAAETARLVSLTCGGALVLSTSIRNMHALRDVLREQCEGPVLMQGDAPKNILIERFSSRRDSVLCATTSFWQGVDLPGDLLRLVVIDKLPFAPLQDPLETARIARLTEQGHNAFREYQLPAAALALKQGFGRLIRTKDDTGIVAILDPRLRTMPYGRTFILSLPACPYTADFEAVRVWWYENVGARCS